MSRKECAAASYDGTVCAESLEETVKNFDKNVLSEMRRIDLRSLASFTAAKRPLGAVGELLSSRKVSYVSADSFEQNRNGWTALPAPPTVTVDLRGNKPRYVEIYIRYRSH